MRLVGLGSTDERIVSEIHGAESRFEDLTHYLRLLIREMSLGSDRHARGALHRFRDAATTEAGGQIQSITLAFSSEESRRYHADFIDLRGRPEIDEIITDLNNLVEDLHRDRSSSQNSEGS